MGESQESSPGIARISLGVVVSAGLLYLVFWILVSQDVPLWLFALVTVAAVYLAERLLKLILRIRHLTPVPHLKDDDPREALRRLPVNLIPVIPIVPVLIVPFSPDGQVNLLVFVPLAIAAALVEIALLLLVLRRP